jgi:hypothetical protein
LLAFSICEDEPKSTKIINRSRKAIFARSTERLLLKLKPIIPQNPEKIKAIGTEHNKI